MDQHIAAATGMDGRPVEDGTPSVCLDPRFAHLVPSALVAEPRAYVLSHLCEMKPNGEPMRVYDLPSQRATDDSSVIAKVAKPKKVAVVDRRGNRVCDPLFELKILYWLAALDLPCARGIGHVAVDDQLFLLYRKIPGYTAMEPHIHSQLPGCDADAICGSLLSRSGSWRPHSSASAFTGAGG